jgi:phosphatidylserine/phosphatidylglycerophosphate/cardiolipin synthase-like enzyme
VDQAYKFDKVQSAGAKQTEALARLKSAGVRFAIGHVPGGILHDKFAVFDHRIVVTGSYNWTNHARERNRENLLLLDCPDLAKIYEAEWELIETEDR